MTIHVVPVYQPAVTQLEFGQCAKCSGRRPTEDPGKQGFQCRFRVPNGVYFELTIAMGRLFPAAAGADE